MRVTRLEYAMEVLELWLGLVRKTVYIKMDVSGRG